MKSNSFTDKIQKGWYLIIGPILFKIYKRIYYLKNSEKKPKEVTQNLEKIKNNERIYCIGDSHVGLFQKKIEYEKKNIFKVFHIGPATAYNLIKKKNSTGSNEKITQILKEEIPKKSKVLLCFGEIDCRAHILKQAKLNNKDWRKIVNNCVKRYIQFIKNLKRKDYRIIIFGIVPSSPDSIIKNPNYPTYGNQITRNRVTEYFNNLLEKRTEREGFEFISIFKKLIDKDYKTILYYLEDGVHLSSKAKPFVIEELKKKKLI